MRRQHRGPRPDRAVREHGGDDGFLLVETVVSVAVVTIVMTALAVLLVTVTQSTAQQRAAQVAGQLALGALDRARGVGAAGAVSGRDQTSTTTQFTRTPAGVDWPARSASVAPWLVQMAPAVDATAPLGAGATAALPTVARHQVLNSVDYRVHYYVGYCWRVPETPDCLATQGSAAIQYVRVVVAVTWPGPGCADTGCSYVGATLLHGGAEPIFNFNQQPPPAPKLVAVPAQSTQLGAAVTGIRGVAGCAVPCAVSTSQGVQPFVFSATGLPPGLQMDPGGLITGTATTPGAYPVRVNVLDAFLGTDSTTFTWSVVTPLSFANPGPQRSVVGDRPTLALTGTSGGTGGGYSWAATGLPPGLAINVSTGVVTGTLPPSSGSATPYPVTVTLTDGGGNSVQQAFPWTVGYAALAAAAGDRISTVARTITPVPTATLVTGGSGSAVWSGAVTGLPTGLAVAADRASITGRPTATGTFRASGTVADTATGETVAIAFTWRVVAAPTLTNPDTLSTGRNSTTPSVPLVFTCPNGPCTFSLTADPRARVSIDEGTGVMRPASGATRGSYSVTVTITDADGASVSVSFTWRRT